MTVQITRQPLRIAPLGFGLVGLVVNALAFRIAGGMSDAFYVKNFGSALGAALTMSVANIVIQMLL